MPNFIIINNKVSTFKKTLTVEGDKSLSIRSLIFASQANGISKIQNLLESDDVFSTISCLRKLGIKISKVKKKYLIKGNGIGKFNFKKGIILNAGNSGTLARLIIGLLINSPFKIKIIGDKSLSKRDFFRVIEPLSKFGIEFYPKNQTKLPLSVKGSNESNTKIKYLSTFRENKGSAQVKSAIMLSSLISNKQIKIIAKKSRDHTEKFFKFLNLPLRIKKTKKFDIIEMKKFNKFKAFNYKIPSDISSSMFFIALVVLAKKSKISIKNVNINHSRTGAIDILKKMGIEILLKNIKIYKGEKVADIIVTTPKIIKPIKCSKDINSRAIDEFLTIFLIASKANGISTFKDLEELNQKESPRLKIAAKFLTMIGVKNICKKDSIKIFGNPNLDLKGSYIMKNFNKDHRVFMMSCIAALTLGGSWKIFDPDSIKTSFPSFLNHIKNIAKI